MEKLGTTGSLWNIFRKDDEEHLYDDVVDKIITTMVKASKERVGVLIVIQRDMGLGEYTDTGIKIDGVVTSALLSNIFVVNTPLHDGAVIIRGNRIVSATCYLPLTASQDLSKELGTRHRAAVGNSEVTDSYTIVVSEETGAISLAHDRRLIRNLTVDDIKDILLRAYAPKETEKAKIKLWKGIRANEDKSEE